MNGFAQRLDMVRISVISASLLLVFCLASRGWADLVYAIPESTYSQEFDTLASSGSNNPWVDDVTIPGWFANRTSYGANNGSTHSNNLESYGSTSSSERALGARPSQGNVVHFGVRFTNDTGQVLRAFRVTFDGEQWNDRANAGPDSLHFSYLIGTNPSVTSSGFVNVSSLTFTAPVAGETTTFGHGNDPNYRVAGITDEVSGITWNPGQQLLLRWTNVPHEDEAIGIDSFSFSATAIPEPSSFVFGGAVALVLLIGHLWAKRSSP
jgi:hypothetical protein